MATYNTPQALRQAIQSLARSEAKRSGASPGDLVNQYYLSQLITRVFHHDPDGWILKGGQALLIRWPQARHSRDIDLLALGREHNHSAAAGQTSDLEAAVDNLVAASRLSLDAYIRFEHHSTVHSHQERETRRVKFNAYCGTMFVTVVSVDVVSNLKPIGDPVEHVLQPPLRIGEAALATTVRIWPLEDHVADKIAAMYERHRGYASSRYKDLVDLIIIACNDHLDGPTTHAALRSEVQRRITAGVDLDLPPRFTIPDRRSWQTGYQAAAAKTPSLDQRYRTLAQAEELASRLINPLLSDLPPQRWNPSEREWT